MAIREIIFRGKRVDNGEWVKGYYVYEVSKNIHWIFENSLGAINPGFKPRKNDYGLVNVEVIPETISQFTGLKDKNGNKIFERDLIQWSEMQSTSYDYDIEELVTEDYVVEFVNGMFVAKCLEQRFPTHELLTNFDLNGVKLTEIEIIGNIYDVKNETTL